MYSSLHRSSMSATTNLSPVSSHKMKLRKRGMEKPRSRDTTPNKRRIKRCVTRNNPSSCGDSSNREEEEEEEKEGRWSELPYDILDMIVKRIYVIDLINLRAVCKSWRYYSLSEFQPLKITKVPWLMTLDEDDKDDLPSSSSVNSSSSCKLIDPTYKRTYIVNDTKIKEKKLYDMEVQESKCGWVLMSSSQSSGQTSAATFFLLYTPYSTENNLIELPVLNSEFCIATFSSAPSFGTTQQDDDCVFLAFNNLASGGVSISTCRRGDHTWRTRHFGFYFPLARVRSVVYFQRAFYCPSHTGSIGIFNIDRGKWVVIESKTRSEYFKSDIECNSTTIHLLKSDGEFWLVCLCILKQVWVRPSVSVYRLDCFKMIWRWLRLNRVGDRSLFIMKGTSLAIELPKWIEHPGLKHIGFVCRNDKKVRRDGKVMYFRVPIRGMTFDPCYPCTNLYGSYDGQKQIWIEPPL